MRLTRSASVTKRKLSDAAQKAATVSIKATVRGWIVIAIFIPFFVVVFAADRIEYAKDKLRAYRDR